MRERLPIVLSVTALIVAILGWTSAGDAAKHLITGKDIKNNSITAIDIRNGTLGGADIKNNSLTGKDIRGLTSADIRDGSLTAADFAPGLTTGGAVPGPQGPPGPPGPQGPPGPPGATNTRLTLQRVTLSENSQPPFTATATCPESMHVTGGGGESQGTIRAMRPASPSSWRVEFNLDGNPGGQVLVAYAVCSD